MREFVVRFLVFVTIGVGFLGCNWVINKMLIGVKIETVRKLPHTFFFLGDSHIMTALSPEIWDDSKNMGNHGEPLYITWLKALLLKEEIADNKVIIIGVGPQNFSDFNEKKLTITKYASSFFETYYPLLLNTSHFLQEWDLAYSKKMWYKALLKKMSLYPSIRHDKWIGHFEERTYRLPYANLSETIARHYYGDGDTLCSISYAANKALQDIYQVFSRRGVKLAFICPPLHKEYRDAIPSLFWKHFKGVMKQYSEQGVWVLDYSTFYFEDSLFYDYDHLNQQGAIIFTQLLQDTISDYLKNNK